MKQVKNNPIVNILDKYCKSERLNSTSIKQTFDELESGNLKIGIVGKMKSGKSSLVNALFFGRNVLPSGVNPMTVTLTEISYSEDVRVEVELLSSKEVEELKKISDEGDGEKQESATLILDQIQNSTCALDFLKNGTTNIKISLEELPEYVAVGGQLSGIAKKVSIYTNNPHLKGISILDTPGFNDPIVSRGVTTKEELNKCHILLFVHGATTEYDEMELGLVRDQISNDGISEIVDVINQIDMLDPNEYSISQWPEYVASFVETRNQIVSQLDDKELREVIQGAKCLHFSALMALIGLATKLDADMQEDYLSYVSMYPEIQKPIDLLNYSNRDTIIDVINDIAAKRDSYLLEGPKLTALGILSKLKETISDELRICNEKISVLKASQDDILKKQKTLLLTVKAIKEKFSGDKLNAELSALVRISLSNLQSMRKSISESDFKDEIFDDPSLFGGKTKKRNNGHYNIILNRMCSAIRNELSSLRENFDSTSASCIDEFIGQLYNTALTDYKSELSDALKSASKLVIMQVDAPVSPEQISEAPNGKLLATSLYAKNFEERFTDKKLMSYLEPFATCASRVSEDICQTACAKLESISSLILQSQNYNPKQKKQESDRLSKDNYSLTIELKQIDEDITFINSLS